jgi:Skp family chaperone for outer membrane proteins
MNFTGYKTTARLFGALLLATGTVISTQQASHAQAQQFGIVNFRRCAQESKMKAELDTKFAEISKQLLSVFQKMKDANAVFLDANEIKELAALYEKAQPSDSDKKRIEALVGKADLKQGAAKRLDQTVNPTAEQKQELQKLAQAQQDGAAILQAVGDDFQKRVDAKAAELEEQLAVKVREVVAQVAKEKNLALVFDSGLVIYASLDITADVLKVLQK